MVGAGRNQGCFQESKADSHRTAERAGYARDRLKKQALHEGQGEGEALGSPRAALIQLRCSRPGSHPSRMQRSSTVGRIAVARSVDNDDNARWLAQRLQRSFGSSVDVNPRFLGWLLLVICAGPVELSIAQHYAALGENGTLQFCDSLGIGRNRTHRARRKLRIG
jgi:hypothetical protein